MPISKTQIAVWSNNSFLEDSFVGQTSSADIVFTSYKESRTVPYVLAVIDTSRDLNNISQKLISIYDQARQGNQKLTVILLHGKTIDTEKNLYFTELLNNLGAGRPLHRLVIVKDLFQASLLYSETYLENFVLEAIGSRKITISTKGENAFFPISMVDLIESLKKIYYLQHTAGNIFWIMGDPVTDLELAYLIKKNLEDSEGPEFEIEANGPDDHPTLDPNSLGNQSRALLNWEPKEDFSVDLKEAVRRVNEDRSLLLSKLHHVHQQEKHPKLKKIENILHSVKKLVGRLKPKKGTAKIENGPELIKKIAEYSMAAILSIYLLVSLSYLLFTALSLKYLEKTLSDLRRGETTLSVTDLNRSKVFSGIGKDSYSIVSPVISIVAGNVHEKNYNLFVFLDYSQSSLESLQQTYLLAEKIYRTVGKPSSGQFYQDSSLALSSNLSRLYENLNQISLLTSQGKLPRILEEKMDSNIEFKNLKLVEQQIIDLIKTAELIPAFLAGDSAKNIVILFQNSQEIRSTGGTLDYILALVMDQGRVVSKNICRGDEIDSLAVGVITAPPLVSQITGVEDWKTRDLNYNPDFPQTATNVSWILEKTLRFKPDIVLAVNDRLLSSLLLEDKGIILNGQSVTSEVFQKELSTTSPSGLYRDLIGYYLDSILEHKPSLVSLGRVIAKQSEENQILFWSSDESIEKSIVNQTFSGSIYPHTCHAGLSGNSPCLAQTTYFNESNFSLLPLTGKMQRKIFHNVWIEPNQVQHEYLVQYQFIEEIPNQNRDMKMIVQLYSPENSILEGITLDDKNLSPQIASEQQDNQMERFQFPISLSYNRVHTLVIKFKTPLSEPNKLPFNYSLTEYHQPGTVNGNVELTINFPETARPAAITSPVSSEANRLGVVLPPKTATFGVGFVAGAR